jgi:hypothetical protein
MKYVLIFFTVPECGKQQQIFNIRLLTEKFFLIDQ